MNEPGDTNGGYDDIMDYFGQPLDFPLRHFHPIWVRGGQGHSSEKVKVSPQGFWDHVQNKYVTFDRHRTFERFSVPFVTLTSTPVELERFAPHLVDGCLFTGQRTILPHVMDPFLRTFFNLDI